MIDAFGREIRYLRLSVTERCNLRCLYCSPATTDGAELLTPDEIGNIVSIMVSYGVDKVRITGGEPLIRRDLEQIIHRLSAIDGISDLPMTTNGVGLDARISDLVKAGITRFNISLDTLDRDRYQQITGVDGLDSVLSAVDKGIAMGVDVKLNAVLIRGLNDGDVDGFLAYAKAHPVQVRFIELMPIGDYGEDNRDKVVESDEILARHPELLPVGRSSGGVATVYKGEGYLGSVGFISPISHQFCHECNRIRLTADGRIRPCLGDNGETNLQPYLGDDAALREAIHDGIYNKPRGHNFKDGFSSTRDMKHIGG
ncbi:GTP 3',8-cyclase MoaA [Eubacteriales bacterium OttesenSCG-928-M02]|nr:GTP 3',8-cyclase MoaA [Eubacteriales bacterium OttesenSCG-928-M02]